MTATPAVIGLSAGHRLLATSFGSPDLASPDAHSSLQFAAAGGLVYQRALAEGRCKTLPSELFETDLSTQYAAGYRPSP